MLKKKILISDTAPLYPPLWGGPKRIWGLFSNLSARYDLTYIGVDTGQFELVRGIEAAENFLEKRFSMPESYYKYWLPLHNWFFKNLNFDLYTYFYMKKAKNFVDALERQPADLVVCSHPWSWTCLHEYTHVPVVYDAHNCEYVLMQALVEGNLFKPVLCRKTKKLEGDLCSRSEAVLVCSEEDKRHFIDIYNLNPSKIHIVGNGTDVPPLPNSEQRAVARKELELDDRPTALFVGAYYKPNIEAVDFIVNRLAPALPDCQFIIVGTVTNAFSDTQTPDNVSFEGILMDEYLEHYWHAADVALNPMSKGSGVNVKMLDYMAAGIPIVSTPFGCRGLNVENKKQVFIANLKDFSLAIQEILQDSQLRQTLRSEGYSYAAANFDWKHLSEKVERVLWGLLPPD